MVLKPRPNPTTIDTSCCCLLFTFFFFLFFSLGLYLFLSLFAGKPPNFPIWAHRLLEDLQPLLLCITFPMVEKPGKQISLSQPGAGLQEQLPGPPAFLQRKSRCRSWEQPCQSPWPLVMFNQAHRRDATSKQTSRWMSWPLPRRVYTNSHGYGMKSRGIIFFFTYNKDGYCTKGYCSVALGSEAQPWVYRTETPNPAVSWDKEQEKSSLEDLGEEEGSGIRQFIFGYD